jgi:hypothetical protein
MQRSVPAEPDMLHSEITGWNPEVALRYTSGSLKMLVCRKNRHCIYGKSGIIDRIGVM